MKLIEDYALIGNSLSAALIGRDGSIDWLCLPRFDSPSCFTSLLGTNDHGRWKIAPTEVDSTEVQSEARGKSGESGESANARCGKEAAPAFSVNRHYRADTLILETEYQSQNGGRARVVDVMLPGIHAPVLIRNVEGITGEMPFDLELTLRFDYGSIVPWVRKMHNGHPSGIVAIAGPDTVRIHSPIPLQGHNFKTIAQFKVRAGEKIPFVMHWHPSHLPPYDEALAADRDPERAIARAERWWVDWTGRGCDQSPWSEAVKRSLITLKALTHSTTGGIVAAPTTSLPEKIGGIRNWDYRQCWLRDATFTLSAFTQAGHFEEARAWHEWLLRAIAGKPSDLRIMYGVGGERRLTELTLPWLPGFEASHPVRVGNGAFEQLQLDVYGEVMDAFHFAHRNPKVSGQFEAKKGPAHGTRVSPEEDLHDWRVHRKLVEYLETVWHHPDNGIWEIRGEPRHFTHSKVMAWVAVDRAVCAIERFGFEGPLDRWRALRAMIHKQVCREGYCEEKKSFVQHYGSNELDASLLLIPLVGFLPATDPRVRSTVEAIQRELCVDGFVLRYRTGRDASGNPNDLNAGADTLDGLPSGEGAFLACTFWLVDNLSILGHAEEARTLFERLLAIRNDLGLLSEEYDPRAKRFLGNFPQAFSHVALINSAIRLSLAEKKAALMPVAVPLVPIRTA